MAFYPLQQKQQQQKQQQQFELKCALSCISFGTHNSLFKFMHCPSVGVAICILAANVAAVNVAAAAAAAAAVVTVSFSVC